MFDKQKLSSINVISEVKNYYPLIIAFGLVLLLSYQVFIQIIQINWGHFGYAVDDAYIILAMARNFADYGVWGVTPYEIASASSTILYSVLITLIYKLTGVLEILPLYTNIVFALIALGICFLIMRSLNVPSFLNMTALILIIFLTPMISLIFVGMEHIFHIALVLALLYFGSNVICKETLSNKELILFYVLGAILPLVRYEGFFLVLPLTLFILIRKKWKIGIIFLLSSLIPVGLFGAISVLYGQMWIPNSVYLKSGVSSLSIITLIEKFSMIFYKLFYYLPLLMFFIVIGIILLTLLWFNNKIFWRNRTIFLLLALLTTFIHLWIGPIGWFFRYEAYLYPIMIVGVYVAAIELYPSLQSFATIDDEKKMGERIKQSKRIRGNTIKKKRDDQQVKKSDSKFIIYSIVFILMLFFIIPGISPEHRVNSMTFTPMATHNIYEQQYQMGLFIKTYYQNETVVLNDIGAPTFLSNIHLIDKNGLGTTEIAKNYVSHNTSFDLFQYVKSKDAKIALIYDNDFNYTEQGWVLVGRWRIRNNVICYRDDVGIYAINLDEKERLIKNLKEFSKKLPKDVIQSGIYMGN